MGWDGWDGMGRNGTARDGMGWDGMGWEGRGWDWVRILYQGRILDAYTLSTHPNPSGSLIPKVT